MLKKKNGNTFVKPMRMCLTLHHTCFVIMLVEMDGLLNATSE